MSEIEVAQAIISVGIANPDQNSYIRVPSSVARKVVLHLIQFDESAEAKRIVSCVVSALTGEAGDLWISRPDAQRLVFLSHRSARHESAGTIEKFNGPEARRSAVARY